MIVNHTVPNNEAILRRTLRIAYRVHMSQVILRMRVLSNCLHRKKRSGSLLGEEKYSVLLNIHRKSMSGDVSPHRVLVSWCALKGT